MNFSISSLQDTFTIFLGIFIEAIPFVLLGVFVSAFLSHFVSPEKLLKIVPQKRFRALLLACSFGFLFPVCECGNVPVARRLIQKGVKPYVALTFLLAAPAFNPVVIFATWVAFRSMPEIVYMRVILTFLIAFLIGLLFSYHPKSSLMMADFQQKADSCSIDFSKTNRSFSSFFKTAGSEFFEMMSVLIPGAFFASFLQIIVPRNTILSLGNGPILSILSMMFFAFIISVCANVDAFIALSYANTFTAGSLIAFLVFGPMIDLKTIFMFKKIFRNHVIFLLLGLIFLLTFFFAQLYNYFYA